MSQERTRAHHNSHRSAEDSSSQPGTQAAEFLHHERSRIAPGAPAVDAVIDPANLPLSRSVLDRNSEARAASEFLPAVLANPETRVLVMDAGKAPIDGGALALLRLGDVPEAARSQAEPVYLGEYPGPTPNPAILVQLPREQARPLVAQHYAQAAWRSARECVLELSDVDASLLVEASAALNWLNNFSFCPACGAPAPLTNSGWVRVCEREGRELFPRTDPAIIVSVVDAHDRLLLGSAAAWEPNRFSTLAGFVEPGESLEAAVVREVFEEAGVHVERPRYLGSQPWPFPASLMLGFTATARESEAHPDGKEIRELRWFTRDELKDAVRSGSVRVASKTSIARALIEHWLGEDLEEPEEAA